MALAHLNRRMPVSLGLDSSDIYACAAFSNIILFSVSADGSPCQLENVGQPTNSEESITESVKDDCCTVSSNLPPPVNQDAELHHSVQANTETLLEPTDKLESPVATSTPHANGEDAQVQTDVKPPPVPPEEPAGKGPSSANALAFESAEKKDMATSTEELDLPDLKPTLSHTSETSSCQDSTPSAQVTTKAPCIYATNSEPKPKPSNELTRDYIPKVGMTTYTIVPQKSLEKLRYFEVALTLERPRAAEEEGLNIGSLHLEESTAPTEKKEVSEEQSELHSPKPREDLLTSTTTTPTAPTATQDTVNGNVPESFHSSSTTSFSSQTGSPTGVKEVKIPPATKPKPGSFRLAQHKKTPGYYVTSAAEKRLSASTGSGQREGQASTEKAQLPPPPPPPPPPMQCQEDTTGASNVGLSSKGDDKNVALMRIMRQSSLPSKHPSLGLSLEKLRSFAAPRPYSPVTPSRFAQAVSSAVKRSQSLSHSPKSPPTAPLSPITSHPSVMESKGLTKLEVSSYLLSQ